MYPGYMGAGGQPGPGGGLRGMQMPYDNDGLPPGVQQRQGGGMMERMHGPGGGVRESMDQFSNSPHNGTMMYGQSYGASPTPSGSLPHPPPPSHAGSIRNGSLYHQRGNNSEHLFLLEAERGGWVFFTYTAYTAGRLAQ